MFLRPLSPQVEVSSFMDIKEQIQMKMRVGGVEIPFHSTSTLFKAKIIFHLTQSPTEYSFSIILMESDSKMPLL